LVLFVIARVVLGQVAPNVALSERALREFKERRYSDAERDFREITKTEPSNAFAQAYLGHTLFREEKYADAVGPYEKVLTLDKDNKQLSTDQRRITIDQLSMAYGLSGQIAKAHGLLDWAIQQDPEYPLNYYNLACVFAEEGNKGQVLRNLALAFQHKDRVLKGEQMPDPRSDSSFQKYARDEDFLKLMKGLGFK
jgi:predicted Zn-dependent protease